MTDIKASPKKTLVIHPTDASTDFLMPIWQHKGYEILHGGKFSNEMLSAYDRVIMLGHGFRGGLFSCSQFSPMTGYMDYVISDRSAPMLQDKDNIYIWCYASDYMGKHRLNGFATGMFISEVAEARCFGIDTTQAQVDASNRRFAEIVSAHEHAGAKALHEALMEDYRIPGCPVVEYNRNLMRHTPPALAG